MAQQNLPIIDTGPPIRAVRSPICATSGNLLLALCAGLLVGLPGAAQSAETRGRTTSITPLASSEEAPLLLGDEDLFVDDRSSHFVSDETVYSTHSPPGAESWDWWLLPEGLLYKSYIAGEKEPRFSTAFLAEKGGDILWDTVLGGRVGVVRYGTERGIQPEGVQLDLEGGAFVRLLPQDERDVNAVDFRFGVPLTYREGPFQAKFGYYHISSHLGDEYLLKNPGIDRINYVRDALVLGIAQVVRTDINEPRSIPDVGMSRPQALCRVVSQHHHDATDLLYQSHQVRHIAIAGLMKMHHGQSSRLFKEDVLQLTLLRHRFEAVLQSRLRMRCPYLPPQFTIHLHLGLEMVRISAD